MSPFIVSDPVNVSEVSNKYLPSISTVNPALPTPVPVTTPVLVLKVVEFI